MRLFDNFTIKIFIGTLFISCLILLYFRRKFSYWKRRGIPYLKPTFPFGNIITIALRKKTFGLVIQDLYNELKQQGAKYGGVYFFAQANFIAVDPDIIKQVMIKDFNHFHDRDVFVNEKGDPLTAHLFSIGGQKWRILRNKLSPTFTSGKMKMMFHVMASTGANLENVIAEFTKKGEPLDIKDIVAKFTTDIIGSCAFGLECNSLTNPDAEFRKYGRKIFELTFLDGIKNLLFVSTPSLLKFFNVKFLNQEVSDFFIDTLRQTIEYREENNVDRNDMLQLLIKLKNNENLDNDQTNRNEEGITFLELAAQCFVFFVAGFETSSTAMTFALMELAQNQEIQDNLREEIRSVLKKYNGKLTYEAVSEMNYLDKVVNETLRKYPSLPVLFRNCTENWTIPGTTQVIEKGTKIFISNYALHMDPEYYPNPEKFDPERFSEEQIAKRPSFTFLPFGDGPRNCIGLRFGLMQTKVGLISLLKNYKFHLHPKTKVPVEFDVAMVILTHKYGVWLESFTA